MEDGSEEKENGGFTELALEEQDSENSPGKTPGDGFENPLDMA